MPAISSISINDGNTTPVAHVFSPATTNGSKGELENRSATIVPGYETLSIEVRKAASATAANRVIVKMYFPVVASVNGVDTVVRTSSASVEINHAQGSLLQDRKNVAALLSNLLAHATFKAVNEGPEPLY